MRYPIALLLFPALLPAAQLTIDHVTIGGTNLQQMQAALSAAGIASVYGGAHSNGGTEMALVSFPDGSYLELMALRHGATTDAINKNVWVKYLRSNAGPTAWAVRVDNLSAEVQRLKAAGVAVSAPERSGRQRPDGVKLEWEMSTVGTAARGTFFPFLIHDFTPRDQRAFPQGAPVSKTFKGVSRVVLGVRNLDSAIALYRRAYGLGDAVKQVDQAFGAQLATFTGTPIVLAQPIAADSWLAKRIAQFGETPCAFVLAQAVQMKYRVPTMNKWFGTDISWFDVQKLGWWLGFEGSL
jgi:hypothetical protein